MVAGDLADLDEKVVARARCKSPSGESGEALHHEAGGRNVQDHEVGLVERKLVGASGTVEEEEGVEVVGGGFDAIRFKEGRRSLDNVGRDAVLSGELREPVLVTRGVCHVSLLW